MFHINNIHHLDLIANSLVYIIIIIAIIMIIIITIHHHHQHELFRISCSESGFENLAFSVDYLRSFFVILLFGISLFGICHAEVFIYCYLVLRCLYFADNKPGFLRIV